MTIEPTVPAAPTISPLRWLAAGIIGAAVSILASVVLDAITYEFTLSVGVGLVLGGWVAALFLKLALNRWQSWLKAVGVTFAVQWVLGAALIVGAVNGAY